MAPPASRRTGYSRKAQYSVFTGYLLAGLGALLGLVLLGLSLFQPQAFAPLRGVASDATAPAGEATAAMRSGTQGAWAAITGFWQAGRQNAALREEVEIARIRLAEAEDIAAENTRLKALMELSETQGEPVAITRLVGSSAASARRYATIGMGRKHGLVPGMPVISERGVIGRVLETARASSRILLLTDSESVLPVRRAGDDVVAFAEGRGDGLLRIRLINLGLNPLEVGDLMVTSGAGGYYRPGLAVAVVAELTADGALARLVAEPSATNYVMIQPIHQAAAVSAAKVPPERDLPDDAGAGAGAAGAASDDAGRR
ncbi:MAG: rod shape-determining protein MreC [Erythrobacter sp.]